MSDQYRKRTERHLKNFRRLRRLVNEGGLPGFTRVSDEISAKYQAAQDDFTCGQRTDMKEVCNCAGEALSHLRNVMRGHIRNARAKRFSKDMDNFAKHGNRDAVREIRAKLRELEAFVAANNCCFDVFEGARLHSEVVACVKKHRRRAPRGRQRGRRVRRRHSVV